MKEVEPEPSANGESWSAERPRRRDTVVIEDGPHNPWPKWAWQPEKSEEIQSFMRQCRALQEADPQADERWHAESEHFAPWRKAFERQERWWDADLRLRDKKYGRRPTIGEAVVPRWDRWLRLGMKLDEATRGQYWLCRIKAELARAELHATDPDASDREATRDWLVQCQWFEKFLTECWSAECERAELDGGDNRRQLDSDDLLRWNARRRFQRVMELRWRNPKNRRG